MGIKTQLLFSIMMQSILGSSNTMFPNLKLFLACKMDWFSIMSLDALTKSKLEELQLCDLDLEAM